MKNNKDDGLDFFRGAAVGVPVSIVLWGLFFWGWDAAFGTSK